MYERDVFFDAVITSPEKGFLANDSITPHTQGPYKDPVPITMLKIAPGCKLEFRFLLHDTDIQDKNGEIFTADRKRDIFKEILTTVGVGAKTNVGYGQLKEV
jgi:CRISPR-associated protein Cmr6